MKEKQPKIIIEGVTPEGESFRPHDWAERMSDQLSTLRGYRVRYSPLLQPSVQNGHQCVILDPKLKVTNPKLYQSILEFAERNQLKICKNEQNDPGSDNE